MLSKMDILLCCNQVEQCLELRAAKAEDLDLLRTWKNSLKHFFFTKQDISPAQQIQWFESYLSRQNDYMFIVTLEKKPIGCMGIRLLVDGWDAYNILRGGQECEKKGFMSIAFQKMLFFAHERKDQPIHLRVLKINPAITWYERNGMMIIADKDDHFLMRYFNSKEHPKTKEYL